MDGAIMKIISVLVILMAVAIGQAHAEVPASLAVRAIIGEASGEGYAGMLAVAEAIRNRGNLKGVYGVNAKHVDSQPEYVWTRARKAWKDSAYSNVTSGANGWGTKKDIEQFKREGWWPRAKVTAVIGSHTFYKG